MRKVDVRYARRAGKARLGFHTSSALLADLASRAETDEGIYDKTRNDGCSLYCRDAREFRSALRRE